MNITWNNKVAVSSCFKWKNKNKNKKPTDAFAQEMPSGKIFHNQ